MGKHPAYMLAVGFRKRDNHLSGWQIYLRPRIMKKAAVKEKVEKEDQAEHNHGLRPYAKRKYGKKTADCACPCKFSFYK